MLCNFAYNTFEVESVKVCIVSRRETKTGDITNRKWNMSAEKKTQSLYQLDSIDVDACCFNERQEVSEHLTLLSSFDAHNFTTVFEFEVTHHSPYCRTYILATIFRI